MTKSSGKVIKVLIASLVLLVLFLVVANILGNTADYYSTVKKMVGCIENNDSEKLESCASSMSIAALGGEEKAHESITADIKKIMDKYNAEVGRITNASYTVTNEQELSIERVEAIKKQFSDLYGLDTGGIKRILKVGIILKLKGELSDRDYQMSIYLVRESGGWKLYNGNL